VQIGRPNASHAVVLEGLQGVLNTLIDNINTAGRRWRQGLTATVAGVTVPTSSHVKVS